MAFLYFYKISMYFILYDNYGKVFWYWHIGHFGTPPLLLRASMARGYLAASLAGAVLRAASAASRPLCLARQYSG